MSVRAILWSVLAAGVLGLAVWLYSAGRHDGVLAEKGRSAAAQGQAAAASAQAAAAQEAIAIVDRGAQGAIATRQIEGNNHAVILQAPGAGDRIDPDLVSAAVRGLCRYKAYDGDHGCAVLAAHSGELSGAGLAGSSAAR